ncbi:MAG: hypothetical protein ABSA52_19865 [Candidatus Binatia bacterium]
MQSLDHRPRVGQTLAAGIILLFLSLLFWKVRIIDLGVNETHSFHTDDLYAQYYPMVEYGFASLRSGHIPLWNPYQLCGEPFLATAPYVGLFYPLNLPFLFFSTGAAIEITLILHMLLGALGMWLLLRHFGISTLGAVCAGLTFIWSGWLMFNVNHPWLYGGMTWMPLTVLLFELAVRGVRKAQLGVVIAVGCQVVEGAEILPHTLYAASLFALARLALMAWRNEWRVAVRRAVVLALCVAAAALLGALQLLPTFELIGLTPRGAMSFEQASSHPITPQLLLEGALEIPRALQIGPIFTVGVLPLLGLTLALGFPKYKLLWITALVAVGSSAFLAFGGWAFRLYYALPVIGHLFRWPVKFLDIYTFGLAVLAGVALSRLESWAALPRRRLWLHPAWLVTLALGGLAAWWAQTHIVASLFVKGPSRYLPAMLALLVVFGLIASPRWRRVVLVCICVLQAASLFFVTGTYDLRPWRWPYFTQYDDVLQSLRQRAGYSRAFVYGHLGPWPLGVKRGIEDKQMRNRVFLTADYDVLVASRYGSFFDLAAPRPEDSGPFGGGYNPGMGTRWKLMDLTGTKYFVAYRGDLADAFLRQSGALTDGVLSLRLIRDGFVRIYEKENVLPRAYFVSHVRTLSSPEAVLAALDTPSFDPRLEVLLEEPEAEPLPATAAEANAAVHITRYEPERVEIEVDATGPGYLVLGDLHYPGWKAFVGDREVPIFRANYLFRAVRLEPGHRGAVRVSATELPHRLAAESRDGGSACAHRGLDLLAWKSRKA